MSKNIDIEQVERNLEFLKTVKENLTEEEIAELTLLTVKIAKRINS